jgi:hypothetical protein
MTSPSEITPAQAAYEAKLAAEGARHGIALTSAWDSDGFAGRDDWAAAAEAAVKAAPVDLTDLAEWVELLRERDEMVEEILQNADELEDGGDAPAEVLAVRYVRRLEAARSVLAEIFASMGTNATQYPQDLQKVRLDDWRQRAGLVTP